MSLTENLRRGMVIRFEDHLYSIMDFRTSHSGKQRPTVHVKLRSIPKGLVSDRTLDELGKIEEVSTEFRQLQYLYHTGKDRIFMDSETFEECCVAESMLSEALPFLVAGEDYRFMCVDGRILQLQVPEVLVMEVTDTAPVEHVGGSNVLKDAKMASGITIRVPLFIKTGEKIRVKTDTMEYGGKVH